MKVKEFIKQLEGLDQESDIFFLEEDRESGEEKCFYFAVCENQVCKKNNLVERYYTIEKRD